MNRKLTLSADEGVIREAKRLARCRGTSVSVMFSHLVRSMARAGEISDDVPVDSIAARATGFISLPEGEAPRDVLTQALMEKHGIEP